MKIGVVAGSLERQLNEYLKAKGTVEIAFSVKSIVEEADRLSKMIINLDKLVLVFPKDSQITDVMNEFLQLRTLLEKDLFFRSKEFLVVTTDSEIIDFFEYFMAELDREEYKCVETDEISVTNINSYILGLEEEVVKDTKITKVYLGLKRPPKIDITKDAKGEFKSIDYRENIKKYEYVKEKLYSTGIVDREVDVPSIRPLEIVGKNIAKYGVFDSNVSKRVKIVVVTGMPKSGKTVTSIGLAISGSKSQNKVMVIDMSDNQSTTNQLEVLDIDKNILYVDEVKGGGEATFVELVKSAKSDMLNLISFKGLSHLGAGAKAILLYKMMSAISEEIDTLIVEVPLSDLDLHVNILHDCHRLLVTTSNKRDDLSRLKDYLRVEVEPNRLKYVVNRVYTPFGDADTLEPKQIKKYMDKKGGVTSLIEFKGLSIDYTFFERMIEV